MVKLKGLVFPYFSIVRNKASIAFGKYVQSYITFLEDEIDRINLKYINFICVATETVIKTEETIREEMILNFEEQF